MAAHRGVVPDRPARLVLGFTLVGALALVFAVFQSPASAEPDNVSRFVERYPAAAASQLNGCLLCHRSPDPWGGDEELNAYGNDWEERGDGDFRAIESLDSDRDGFTNLQEIQALSFPGEPSSTPLTVTTTTTVPGQAPDGAALYAASCAGCHGSGGGNLRNTSLAVSQFASIVANGQGSAMPGFGAALSEAQIAAIYAYVTGAPAPATTTTAPGTPIDAAALFAGSCAGCHGAGGGNLVPTGLSGSQLVSVITNGRGSMPSYGSGLSTSQIQALADYLLSRSAAPTSTTAPGGRLRSGSSVYAADCAGCHGPSGGNLTGTSLSRSQLVSVTTNGRDSMPAFGARLPAGEISAVADYILSLAATTTTAATEPELHAGALYAMNCSGCHGFRGEGGSGGVIAGIGLSEPEIRSIIADGTGEMPGFAARLSEDELVLLVGFVVDLAGDTTGGGDSPGGEGAGGSGGPSTSTTSRGAIAAPPDIVSIPDREPEEPGRPGSPWVPAAPVLAAGGWIIVEAVRRGHLIAR